VKQAATMAGLFVVNERQLSLLSCVEQQTPHADHPAAFQSCSDRALLRVEAG